MKIDLPYALTLRKYQIPLWKATVVDDVRNAFVIWPRRNGKDLITLNIVIAKAMQRVGLYLYVAPYYGQIRTIIWEGADNAGRRFLDYIPRPFIKQKFDSRMAIELINGSIIKFAGADNMDSLVGGNPVGIVRTEASLHKSGGWDYLRPILVENGGWAIHNGTPRGLTEFYTMAEMAKNNPLWFHQHLTCEDTGHPTLEMIAEERRAGMPESMIQQEYYCSFLASNEATLIPLDLLQPCINRPIEPEDYQHSPRLIGVDPAYSAKGDQAIIAKRQGRLLHPLRKFKGVDNMQLADEIAQDIKTWRPHGVLIDAGRGEGVISRLHRLGYEDLVIPVNFGGGAYNSTLYLNKRAEIWCAMRDWFMAGGQLGRYPTIPNDQNLITGLSTPTLLPNENNGRLQVESKKAIRLRGAYVMDEPDAVAVTFAEPSIEGDQQVPGHYSRIKGEIDSINERGHYRDEESVYDCLDYFNRDQIFRGEDYEDQ